MKNSIQRAPLNKLNFLLLLFKTWEWKICLLPFISGAQFCSHRTGRRTQFWSCQQGTRAYGRGTKTHTLHPVIGTSLIVFFLQGHIAPKSQSPSTWPRGTQRISIFLRAQLCFLQNEGANKFSEFLKVLYIPESKEKRLSPWTPETTRLAFHRLGQSSTNWLTIVGQSSTIAVKLHRLNGVISQRKLLMSARPP